MPLWLGRNFKLTHYLEGLGMQKRLAAEDAEKPIERGDSNRLSNKPLNWIIGILPVFPPCPLR